MKPRYKAFSFMFTNSNNTPLNFARNVSPKEVQKSHHERRLEISRQNLTKIRNDFFSFGGQLLKGVGSHIVERSKYEVTHGWTSSLLKAGWTVLGGAGKVVTTPVSLVGSLVGATGEKVGDVGDSLIEVNRSINNASTRSIGVGFNKVRDALSDRLPKAERLQRIELKNIEIMAVLQTAIIDRQKNISLLDEIYRLYPEANPSHQSHKPNFDYYSALLEVVDEDGERSDVEEKALRRVVKLTKEKNPNWIDKGLKTSAALLEASARTAVGTVGYGVGTTVGLAGSIGGLIGKPTEFVGNSFGSVFQNNWSEAITDGLSNPRNSQSPIFSSNPNSIPNYQSAPPNYQATSYQPFSTPTPQTPPKPKAPPTSNNPNVGNGNGPFKVATPATQAPNNQAKSANQAKPQESEISIARKARLDKIKALGNKDFKKQKYTEGKYTYWIERENGELSLKIFETKDNNDAKKLFEQKFNSISEIYTYMNVKE